MHNYQNKTTNTAKLFDLLLIDTKLPQRHKVRCKTTTNRCKIITKRNKMQAAKQLLRHIQHRHKDPKLFKKRLRYKEV